MTFIGKLFVMLNLVLSMLMAGAAFSLYSTNPDMTDKPGKGDAPPGKLVPLKAEFDELLKQMALIEGSWASAHNSLLAQEEARGKYRAWYDAEMKKLYPATTAKIQEVSSDAPDKDSPVTMKDAEEAPGGGKNLLPYDAYVKQLKDNQDQNDKLRKSLTAKIKEDTDLTGELVGDADKGNRGLRQRIGDERVKRQGIVDEQGIEDGLRVNTEFESELIRNRLQLINKRLNELKVYLKKRHSVDADEKGR